jgi:hypothetical protein
MEVEPALTKVKLSGGIFYYYCSLDAGLESEQRVKNSKKIGHSCLILVRWVVGFSFSGLEKRLKS